MGTLVAREAVVKASVGMLRGKPAAASESVIVPIVGCSRSVGTVDTTVPYILISPSSVTCYEEKHLF